MGDEHAEGIPSFLEFALHTRDHGSFHWRPALSIDMRPTTFEVIDFNGVPLLQVPVPVDEHTSDRCRCRITKLEYSTVAVHFDTTEGLVRLITLSGQVAMSEEDWFALVLGAPTIRARASRIIR